ncbi:ribosome hibernation-promoting factor, HPF/YfiA family [Thermoproteota archaeon]
MIINVKARHVSITPPLKDYAKKKFEKLAKFFNNIQEISIELDVIDTADEAKRHSASATVWASGKVIKAQEASRDMYASIDMLLSKTETQLKKYKDKLKEYQRAAHKREFSFTPDSESRSGAGKSAGSSSGQPKISEEKLYIPKPMAPEDAAAIVEMDNLRFLAFRNIETEEINVIYPLKQKDQYGLIEP